MKNGSAARAGVATRGPARFALNAAPIDRAMPVTPAAADRSSGATTAIV
jgi:hypothetical protein